MDMDEYAEEAIVDRYRDDRDLMHRILNDSSYPELVAALHEVVTTESEDEDPEDDVDYRGIDIGIAMDRLYRQLDEPTMAWLGRYAEAPARYLADLVRGRVPAQSA